MRDEMGIARRSRHMKSKTRVLRGAWLIQTMVLDWCFYDEFDERSHKEAENVSICELDKNVSRAKDVPGIS